MSLRKTLTDNPTYIGLLAASTVCIALMVTYFVTALLAIPFNFFIPPDVLAAIAAILAAVAVAISDSNNGDEDGR